MMSRIDAPPGPHNAETWVVPDAGSFHDRAELSYTLPSDWYTEPEFLERERTAIFYRNWWYFCGTSDLADTGDFVADSVMNQDVFVIRNRDGTLRGFHNVCSHRAHPLLSGNGRARMIVCPYHQWRYDLDGRFLSARGKETLGKAACERAGLKEIRVETLGCLVFVCLSPEAPPLSEVAAELSADMKDICPGMDGLIRVDRYERTLDANWKTVLDNNHECYHCDANHRTLYDQVDFRGGYRWSEGRFSFSHKADMTAGSDAAFGIDRLEQQGLFAYLWPNTIPLFWPGSPNLALFQVIPLAQERTLERWDFYLSRREPSANERELFDFIRDTLIPEDVGLCERVQRGLHSLAYKQGKFVVDRARTDISEHHVHKVQHLVWQALTGRGGACEGRAG